MKIITPESLEFNDYCKQLYRRALPDEAIKDKVSQIIQRVKDHGDLTLVELAKQFDQVDLSPEQLLVSEEEFTLADKLVDESTKQAIAASLRNVHAFARQSLRQDWKRQNEQGAWVGERFRPFQRVGVYIPGGKAPLVSTVIMTAGFAQAAGVPEIIAVSPCGQQGIMNPALLYAMKQAGVTQVLKSGGAQAIAALALGTESIRPVDLIVGPGNAYVVEAKRQLVGAVSIDLLPGPSEVLIIADDSANPAFVAADLLAQAEHGGDSIIGLISDSLPFLEQVKMEVARQFSLLKRQDIMQAVLENGTFLLHLHTIQHAIDLCNDFCPEHLSLVVRDEASYLEQIRTTGAIYLGHFSAVAVGDFLAGPSHTLPTGGAGRSFSGLRADQFQHRTSIVQMDQAAVQQSLSHVEALSQVEGLDAHAHSVSIRAHFKI